MYIINLKIIRLLIIIILFFSYKGISQNVQTNSSNIMGTINASGADAASGFGTVTYSIGQVFYTYIGLSVFNVAQGVQHEDIEDTLSKQKHSVEPKTEIFIFPNPTTDYVIVNMEGYEFKNGIRSYQLYDLQGRLLNQNTINQTETQIDLNNLNSAIYILQIYVDNKVLKTFKIIKK